ncbi:hypothetical protein B0O80DRAFT_457506 [Mortierella sp. GBAus27b]|nr:hypothetical protein B0O80DRAFT_457506 [Mortierella sp. GBAus27b]
MQQQMEGVQQVIREHHEESQQRMQLEGVRQLIQNQQEELLQRVQQQIEGVQQLAQDQHKDSQQRIQQQIEGVQQLVQGQHEETRQAMQHQIDEVVRRSRQSIPQEPNGETTTLSKVVEQLHGMDERTRTWRQQLQGKMDEIQGRMDETLLKIQQFNTAEPKSGDMDQDSDASLEQTQDTLGRNCSVSAEQLQKQLDKTQADMAQPNLRGLGQTIDGPLEQAQDAVRQKGSFLVEQLQERLDKAQLDMVKPKLGGDQGIEGSLKELRATLDDPRQKWSVLQYQPQERLDKTQLDTVKPELGADQEFERTLKELQAKLENPQEWCVLDDQRLNQLETQQASRNLASVQYIEEGLKKSMATLDDLRQERSVIGKTTTGTAGEDTTKVPRSWHGSTNAERFGSTTRGNANANASLTRHSSANQE